MCVKTEEEAMGKKVRTILINVFILFRHIVLKATKKKREKKSKLIR